MGGWFCSGVVPLKKKNVARWPMSAGLLLIVIAAADYRKICIPTLDSEHN